MLKQRALLCGSVNLANAEDVFRAIASEAGDVVSRLPDGETGARNDFIVWQKHVLARQAQLEESEPFANEYRPHPRWRIKESVKPEEIELGSLGYADAAIESYRTFTRLRQEGVIAAGSRFQVSLPTPLAVVGVFIDPRDALRFEPVYERYLLDEMRAIADAIPHEELAIQWDAAVEFAMLEGFWATYVEGDLLAGLAERTARAIDAVPLDVEVGLHLCYGDSEGKHFKQPEDTSLLVTVAAAVLASTTRTLDWLHLPVPIERDDDAYFAPLADLVLPEETTLYLGLLHKEDGLEGARRRIAAAKAYVSDFGVATECGIARDAAPEDIPSLLRLHAEAGRELERVAV
jgi:hypothetical protein